MAKLSSFRTVVTPKGAAKPVGPYSPAIRFGDLLFVAGQGPRDPKTGEIARGVEAETRQVLDNLKTIVEGAGCRMADVLHTRVYLTDISDFAAMNAVYRAYFPADPPARTTVAVSALPEPGARVEMDVVVGARPGVRKRIAVSKKKKTRKR